MICMIFMTDVMHVGPYCVLFCANGRALRLIFAPFRLILT